MRGNEPKRGETDRLVAADGSTRRETPQRADATIEADGATDTRMEPSAERAVRDRESEPPPRMVGRFEIQSLLGKGGMARVYRAFDPSLDRLVALKLLHGSSTARSADAANQRKRIVREARAAAALTHPNTVVIYEVGEADGQPYIAMELLEGVTLRAALNGDAARTTRLRWLLQAASALFAAHECGLVHRDVKPDNMIIDTVGRLRLLDFGIAKRDYGDAEAALAAIGLSHPDGPSSLRTVAGRQLGTPRYMAPEQRAGEGTDARTDQYAWGLVAFEVLTGAVPAPEQLPAPRLRELDVPEEVIEVIARALSPRMEDRASSMQPIIEALERAASASQHSLPIASGMPPTEATAVLATTEAAAPARRSAGWVAVALGGLVLLGGGAYAAVRHRVSRGTVKSEASASEANAVSRCTLASSSAIAGFYPSEASVASGFTGTLLGAYERGRAGRPDSGVAVASVAGGSHSLAFLGYPPDRHHGAWLRTIASREPGTPFSFVALYNRDGDAYLGGWRDPESGPVGMPFGVVVMRLIATGMSAAPYRNGVLAAFTGQDTRQSGVDNQVLGLVPLGVGYTPLLDAFRSSVALDAPALAISPRRVAVAFRRQGKLLLSLFDDAIRPLGDAMTITATETSYPAATYVGDTLLLSWAERVGSAARLRTAMLLPGSKEILPGPSVDDASSTTAEAPVTASLPTGETLIAWFATAADGISIRAARLSVGTSATTSTISRSFEIAPAGRLRSLSAAPSADGVSVGWIDEDAKGARLANVGCAAAPSAVLPAR